MQYLLQVLLSFWLSIHWWWWFSCSVVSNTCDPMDCCSLPGSSVYGILQQEYWSGLPFPSPGDLPDPGIKARSPELQAVSLLTELHSHLVHSKRIAIPQSAFIHYIMLVINGINLFSSAF